MSQQFLFIFGSIPGASAQPAYDFAKPADYVVVNLGTNDFIPPFPLDASYAGAVSDHYVSLLLVIRQKYPQAQIIAAEGTILSGSLKTTLDDVIQAALRDPALASDARIHFIDITPTTPWTGCDNHPGLDQQNTMGLALAKMISDLQTTESPTIQK